MLCSTNKTNWKIFLYLEKWIIALGNTRCGVSLENHNLTEPGALGTGHLAAPLGTAGQRAASTLQRRGCSGSPPLSPARQRAGWGPGGTCLPWGFGTWWGPPPPWDQHRWSLRARSPRSLPCILERSLQKRAQKCRAWASGHLGQFHAASNNNSNYYNTYPITHPG